MFTLTLPPDFTPLDMKRELERLRLVPGAPDGRGYVHVALTGAQVERVRAFDQGFQRPDYLWADTNEVGRFHGARLFTGAE